MGCSRTIPREVPGWHAGHGIPPGSSLPPQQSELQGVGGGAALIFCLLCDFQATTSTNWILESQNINELKSEINSLKGLLLNR